MNQTINSKRLKAIYTVCNTINSHLKMDEVLQSVMDVTTQVMNVEASSLVLLDDNEDLNFYITEGDKANNIKQIKMKSGEGIVGTVIKDGEPAIVNDVSEDPRFFSDADKETGFSTRSLLCTPIISEKKILGAIEIINKLDHDEFNKLDLEFLDIIASQSAIAIQNARLHKHIVQNERLTAIGQTITGLAHCIKNVLQGVDAGKFFIQKGLKKKDFSALHKGWDYIKDNTAFIKDLVLDMLTFSKEREPVYEEIDINDLIATTAKLFKKKAGETGAEIILETDENINEICIDKMNIKRCLLNLTTNAIDAVSETNDGRITIKTNKIGRNKIEISVADNGMGIDKKNIPKLFKMFFSTKGSKGTGFGLAVTKKIIDEHHGNIEVESVKGEYTKFIITLPISQQ